MAELKEQMQLEYLPAGARVELLEYRREERLRFYEEIGLPREKLHVSTPTARFTQKALTTSSSTSHSGERLSTFSSQPSPSTASADDGIKCVARRASPIARAVSPNAA